MIPPIAWKPIGSAAMSLLRVAWPLILVAGVALFVANHFYFSPKIEKLKSDVAVVTSERDNARENIEQMNKAILNLSETSTKISDEVIGELTDILDNMNDDNRRVIESILEAGVPEGCADSREFLLDMIGQLQWEELDND